MGTATLITGTTLAHGAPSGVCRKCGRPLSDPVSVRAGMGPVCRGHAAVTVGGGEPADSQLVDLPWDGESGDVVCRRDPDGTRHFNVPRAHVHHSPTGMEWGYGGSGPADLALNVLALFLPAGGGFGPGAEAGSTGVWGGTFVSRAAYGLHQAFKRDVVAVLPREGGTIPGDLIRAWLRAHGVEPAV